MVAPMRVGNCAILFPGRMSTRRHVSFKQHSSFALRPSASKQITIAVARHPFRASEMTVESTASAVRIERGIDLKYDTRDFAPVSVVCFSVEETSISDGMLLVVGGQRWLIRRDICNLSIERRHDRKLLMA